MNPFPVSESNTRQIVTEHPNESLMIIQINNAKRMSWADREENRFKTCVCDGSCELIQFNGCTTLKQPTAKRERANVIEKIEEEKTANKKW